MRRTALTLLAGVVLVALSVGAVAAVGGSWKAPPFASIGINTTYFDKTFVEGGPDGSVVRIWWETRSATEKCLATMGENSAGPAVEQVYCSSRQVTIGDRHPWGLMASVFFAESLPDGGTYSINVYQEGARMFGPPMPITCDDNGCVVIGA